MQTKSSNHGPRIALLLGDCTGIGPEIVAKAVVREKLPRHPAPVILGDERVLRRGMADAGVDFSYRRLTPGAEIDWNSPVLQIVDLGNVDPEAVGRGAVSAESGRVTGETLAFAIDMAQRGEIDAVTFAPLNKAALWAGGWKFPDEHKMFAHLLRHQGHFSEMNVLDGQWMCRVTSHVSLREALDQINERSITDAILLADSTMRTAGIAKPRIAVAALNPHAGENGLFGRDEIDLIRPTVQKVAAMGIDCTGPFPSDTVYIKAFAGQFDSVVAMYHDQGQIATKLRGFNRGVTVTAGLDAVFTTPAHGTAFDIVGEGKASSEALETALALAATLAANRIPAREAAL